MKERKYVPIYTANIFVVYFKWINPIDNEKAESACQRKQTYNMWSIMGISNSL